MTISRRRVVREVLAADDHCMSSIRRRGKTGVHRLGRPHQRDQADPESRVDPAALGLAAVAAGVSVLSGEGDWDLMGTVLGLVLLPVVVAYHRSPPNAGRWRQRLMRLAFSGVAAQILILVLGWPVQQVLIEPLRMTHFEWLQWATATERSLDDPSLLPTSGQPLSAFSNLLDVPSSPLPADYQPLTPSDYQRLTEHDDQGLKPNVAASALLGMFWFLMTGAIYWVEPRLMWFLDRDSPHQGALQRRPSSPYAGAARPSVRRETSSVKHSNGGSTAKR